MLNILISIPKCAFRNVDLLVYPTLPFFIYVYTLDALQQQMRVLSERLQSSEISSTSRGIESRRDEVHLVEKGESISVKESLDNPVVRTVDVVDAVTSITAIEAEVNRTGGM